MSVALATNGQDNDTGDDWAPSGQSGTVGDASPGAGNTAATVVDLAGFEANWDGRAVTVSWETHTEIDHEGFYLWRSEFLEGEYTQITPTLISGEGGETWGAAYSYEDADVVSGITYHYRLEAVSIYGESAFHGPVEATAAGALCFFKALK